MEKLYEWTLSIYIGAGSRIIVQLTMELSVAIINDLQPVAVNDCHK